MAFTVNDVRDLTQVLTLHPEWLGEVRRLVLTAELLMLPDIVRELAKAQTRTERRVEELAQVQARTERRLDHLDATVQKLAEAQARTEQRMEELAQAQARTEQRMEELAQAQARTERRVEELAQAQARTERRVEELAQAQARTEQTVRELIGSHKRLFDQVSQLRGHDLERRYRENAGAFWGRWLRPVEALSPNEVREVLEAHLSEDEVEDVMRLDVLAWGRVRRAPESPPVWLAVEVSAVIDQNDVKRARRRAALLCRAGYRAIPVVAGEQLTEGAQAAVAEAPLIVLQDGHSMGWDEALAVSA